MEAGFARIDITPPIGTPMMGWGVPSERLAESVQDPLYLRALWASAGGRDVLFATVDWCFVGREDSDRFKGVLGRTVGLAPSQVLLSASHSHSGPAVGAYLDLEYSPPPRDYLRDVEDALVHAARIARDGRRKARILAGMSRTSLPMNRRCPRDGKIVNAPNPSGPVHDSLPVCLLEDVQGRPIAVLFAASTHVVCMRGKAISADYPGVAMARLDAHLGVPCSLFLQGVGGDSRPALLGRGRTEWNWNSGWDEAVQIGEILAKEVIAALPVLRPCAAEVRHALVETRWPLQPPRSREDYLAVPPPSSESRSAGAALRYRWAQRQARLLDRGALRPYASVLVQGVQLAETVRLVAIEGEPVGGHGRAIDQAFPASPRHPSEGAATFALGYANGEALYLVTSPMLAEGGYEPESYWEYGYPSSLAPGMEKILSQAFEQLKSQGGQS